MLVESMMGSIRLSALGRDVQVADLYNYYNDIIFPGKILFYFFCDNSFAFKIDFKNLIKVRVWVHCYTIVINSIPNSHCLSFSWKMLFIMFDNF